MICKINSREDAEDICQEVFIRFYNNMDSVIDNRKWLYKAMTFEITNYYNRKANMKRNDVDIDSVVNEATLGITDKTTETRMIIEEAINNMENFKNEKEKVLFDLIAIHNYTYKKAAATIGMTKWQVQYTYSKLEKKILAYLKNKGIKELNDIL